MTAVPAREFHKVAKVGQLADGDIVGIEVDGVPMILYRAGADLYAAQRRCPHQGTDLVDGLVLDGGLLCGSHGWRFDGKTGQHDSSPTCLTTYPVRIVGDDVEVCATPRPRAPDATSPPR